MVNLTQEWLKHLEKLSNITIDKNQEDKFLSKLDSVINMLDKLNEIDTSDVSDSYWLWNSLRVISWNTDFPNKKEIIWNVKHDVINNSIVIKSTLSSWDE